MYRVKYAIRYAELNADRKKVELVESLHPSLTVLHSVRVWPWDRHHLDHQHEPFMYDTSATFFINL